MRLICFPCAGSGGSFFNDWRAMLPAGISLRAITLPGRLERIAEAPFVSFEQGLSVLANELAPDRDGNDIFFGHSLGALLAFEVARRHLSQGLQEPRLLIVAGSVAPPQLVLSVIGRRSRASDEQLLEEISTTDPGKAALLAAHSELRGLSLGVWRDDLRIAAGYRYVRSPPLRCPIIALAGTLDMEAMAASMTHWSMETSGAFQMHEFDGDHMFVRSMASTVVPLIVSLALQPPRN